MKFFRKFSKAFLIVFLVVASLPQETGAGIYSGEEIAKVETDKEQQIRKLREQELIQLRIALGRRLPKRRRADLYFRLAELYLEAYQMEFLLEGRAHEKRLDSGLKELTIDRNRSKPYLQKGLQAASEIRNLRIAYPQMDNVYYFMGFNHLQLGQRKQGLEYFQKIIREYPKSRFAAEAHRELAIEAYDRKDYAQAIQYFQRVIQGGAQDVHPEIYYKLAWVYFRMGQIDSAIESTKKAIEEASRDKEKYLSIREEALESMAIFMTDHTSVDEALRYFDKVAGDSKYYPTALSKLAREYERKAQPEKAIKIYETLIKIYKEPEDFFQIFTTLVELELRRAHYDSVLNRVRTVQLPDSSDSEELQQKLKNLKAMVRRTATEHHERYRKKKSKVDLRVAENFYELYLTRFLAQKNASRDELAEIKMYLAEVKSDSDKPKEAKDLYRQVVELQDKRYSKEAAAFWVSSLSDAIRQTAKGRKSSPSDNPSSLELEYIEASDLLQKSLKGTSEARESALRSAQILGGYSSTQGDAIRRANQILEESPQTPQGVTAAQLWLQILGDRLKDPQKVDPDEYLKNSELLKDAIAKLNENKELLRSDRKWNQGKLNQKIEDLRNDLRVGSISIHERRKDYLSAARAYEDFATDTKRRDLAEKAYENAISHYALLGDLDSVNRLIQVWLNRFPKSPSAGFATRNAATFLFIQGQFKSSGLLFEKLGRSGESIDSGNALELAGDVFLGIGEKILAESAWQDFLRLFSRHPQVGSVSLKLGRLQEDLGKESAALKSYEFCLGRVTNLYEECGVRIAELFARLKDMGSSKEYFQKVVQKGGAQRGTRVSPFVGYAQYRLSEMLESTQNYRPLELPEKKLEKAVAQRIESFVTLEKAYGKVVQYGGPWGIAALHRLARWSVTFAKELDALNPPSDVRPEEFERMLRGISQPIRAKAAETWKRAYVLANQSEILAPVLPEVLDELNDLRIQPPMRAQGAQGEFWLAGISRTGGEEGSNRSIEKTRMQLEKNQKDARSWMDYGNLLLGSQKSGLAKIAYERASILESQNPSILNNLGVSLLEEKGLEDWIAVHQAVEYLRQALSRNRLLIQAKYNLASLFNTFRLFSKAYPLWEQVHVKDKSRTVLEGYAIAAQGLGKVDEAKQLFNQSSSALNSFAKGYHEAARFSMQGKGGAKQCSSFIDDVSMKGLGSFERRAVTHLTGVCSKWQESN